MKSFKTIILGLLIAFFAGATAMHLVAAEQPKQRFFEIRTYTATEGRMDALQARFRDHTLRLFEKHGITSVGYWVTINDAAKPEINNKLIYVLAYPDRAARDKSWADFGADPEWVAAKKASEDKAGGSLTSKVESVFVNPTDYSPIK